MTHVRDGPPMEVASFFVSSVRGVVDSIMDVQHTVKYGHLKWDSFAVPNTLSMYFTTTELRTPHQ